MQSGGDDDDCYNYDSSRNGDNDNDWSDEYGYSDDNVMNHYLKMDSRRVK